MTATTDAISVDDILADRLPDDATGVQWGGWIECRDHLLDPSWSAAVEQSDERDGIVLRGDVVCDACAERDREAAADAYDLALDNR